MRSIKKTDNAVSPVVGVMLMIVVTIIIAAVVAAFASGLATETQKSPIAQFGVSGMTVSGEGSYMGVPYGPYLTTLTLVNKGGDIIQAGDIDIALKCDGSTRTYSYLGYKYNTTDYSGNDEVNVYNFTVSNTQITAGNTIILSSYKNDILKTTGFELGKSVEFTVIDKATGNSIAGGNFIVS